MANDNDANDGIIDLEEYSKTGIEIPQTAVRFRIKIDKQKYEVNQPAMKGSEILALAGKSPTGYRLDMKIRGGQTKKIEPTDTVDFRQPGTEKFMTLPLDQTEGGIWSDGE
jgi:hypothetical protein